jgi:acyl-CoA synthetase (AMP-forming)/AMP-acid ligase II
LTLIVPETIGDLIVASARRHAALPAVSDASRSLTYAELADWGSRLSNVLAGRGLRVGTRVALLVEDEALSLPAYLGTWLAGCTVVHVNARLAVPESDYILDDSEADALLYSPGFWQRGGAARQRQGSVVSPRNSTA